MVYDKATLECTTCWDSLIQNDTILVAGSDGFIYSLNYDNVPNKNIKKKECYIQKDGIYNSEGAVLIRSRRVRFTFKMKMSGSI